MSTKILLNLRIVREIEDVRGKIIFLSYGKLEIRLVEIKKGFSRGGHYHKVPTSHIVLAGKIEYKGKNMDTGIENTKTVASPEIIFTPANEAHLVSALEDTIFIETFDSDFEATNYSLYRNIVEEKMNSK